MSGTKQAEHPNLVLARALWTAVADGDADTIRRLLDPEVRWRSVGRNQHSGEHRGSGAVLDYLASIGESVDQLASSLDCVYVNDDGAVVCYHTTARRGSRRLEMDYLLRLRVREGRVLDALIVPADQRGNDAFWK